MDSSIDIEKKAADWLARRDADAWSDDDQARLEEWLKATAHRVAYLRLETAWRKLERLQALGAGNALGSTPEPGAWSLSPFFRQRPPVPGGVRKIPLPAPRTLALAATILVTLLLGLGWYFLPQGRSYRTEIGAIQIVPMIDGSTVVLNTDSRIRIEVSAHERRVQLQQGEAFFEVAKDPMRPFVVAVGDRRVIAVGTKFSARRDAEGLYVAVTEGKVKIEDGGKAADPSAPATEIAAGAIARAIGRSIDQVILVRNKPLEEIEQALSWRSGYLTFRATPLAQAVTEFNRYNARKIVIEDPALADVLIGGNFRSTNVEAFLRLLQDGFGIRWEERGSSIVLTEGGS